MVNPRIVNVVCNRTYVTGCRLTSLSLIRGQATHMCQWRKFTSKNFDNNREFKYNRSLVGYVSLTSVLDRSISTSNLKLAKSKDRGKDKKKPIKVQVNLNELSEIIDVEKLTMQMERVVNNLKNSYSKNLTLRSTAGSVEQLSVTWEGKEYKIQELCQIARKPKALVINASAFPQVIPTIIQAIAKSGMNLNPQQDGTTLFLPIPKVTKEHRENLAKSAKSLYIGCRDDIKDVQLRCIKSLKNKTDVSNDTVHNVQNQVQTLADKFVGEAETIFKTKQNELLGDSD